MTWFENPSSLPVPQADDSLRTSLWESDRENKGQSENQKWRESSVRDWSRRSGAEDGKRELLG